MMSCDKLEAVPIDTHVWHIAVRDYGLAKASKSLTATAYAEIGRSCDNHVTVFNMPFVHIGDYFRDLFGPMAGWATSVSYL